MYGNTLGVMKGDTRGLDYSSHEAITTHLPASSEHGAAKFWIVPHSFKLVFVKTFLL